MKLEEIFSSVRGRCILVKVICVCVLVCVFVCVCEMWGRNCCAVCKHKVRLWEKWLLWLGISEVQQNRQACECTFVKV